MGNITQVAYIQTQELAEVAYRLGALEAQIKLSSLDRTAIRIREALFDIKEEVERLDNAIRSSLVNKDTACDLLELKRSSIFKFK